MSGFKGMPGPWRAVDKRPYSDGFSIFSGNQYVAFVGDSDGVTDYLSNANLIAAAPDLLEALQKIVEMNAQYCHDKYGDSSKAEAMACVRVARAAIDKALGNN